MGSAPGLGSRVEVLADLEQGRGAVSQLPWHSMCQIFSVINVFGITAQPHSGRQLNTSVLLSTSMGSCEGSGPQFLATPPCHGRILPGIVYRDMSEVWKMHLESSLGKEKHF